MKHYDLSTSTKRASLSAGNHQVTIVAKAQGYADSAPSSAVTVVKPQDVFNITNVLSNVTGNGSISFDASCLTGDTLITLTDGSQKRIDEITTADKVLSINPETNELEADEIIYCDSVENKTHTEYDIYMLSDGTEIKTVHRHRFYNIERQAMVYMDEWNIGEHAIKQDGTVVELISSELIKETVKHYTIFTKNQNYFANGLLSGNRHTESMHFNEV